MASPATDRLNLEVASPSAGFGRAEVLDAGCGTGRHAAAPIEHGHEVSLLDASAELLVIARKRCREAPALGTDLCDPTVIGSFDAVIARGVLNDLLTDRERTGALRAFAGLTRAGGVLVLDVRETTMSRPRADGTWRTADAELPDGSHLRFLSRPTWNDGRIVVEERHELEGDHREAPEPAPCHGTSLRRTDQPRCALSRDPVVAPEVLSRRACLIAWPR